MWFRRDLRLADNPALLAAIEDAERVLPLFVVDLRLLAASGANRRAWLAGCLAALHESLDGNLVVRQGDPVVVVPAVAAEVGASAVYCAEDFGPYGRARDTAVAAHLAIAGRELRREGTPYAVAPGSVFTGSGTPFKVFTPFSKGWRAHGWDEPLAAPDVSRVHWETGVPSEPRPTTPVVGADLPEPGERAARARCDAFLDSAVDAYQGDRNRPDRPGTSRLSPDLKWGTLHPRQVLARLGDGPGHRTFATELCWREFYADVLFHRPDSATTSLNPAMAAMEVDTGPEADAAFLAWCEGRTGYPIVDAGMRQLLAEGWMHNRVRMIVASFLVKDLHLDWRRGARWFMAQLVDGDLASNQHGWQWVAGTGTDAAPYFRIFNPVAQGLRFDPDGEYVRRYVPELRGVPGKAAHEPWARAVPSPATSLFGADGADGADGPDGPDGADGTGEAATYPERIVDHATERDEALRRYQALRAGR